MTAADVEAEIERHRPKVDVEGPASAGVLWKLNSLGLLLDAVTQQLQKDPGTKVDTIVSKETAWEVMAAAARRGVVIP